LADFTPTVFVVDDDASVRDALSNLLESVGIRVQVFSSSEEFCNSPRPDVPSCLVLDVRLPGKNGLELQETFARNGVSIPIIFITAHGDVPMASRALRAGAIEFLLKPFQKEDLLRAIHHGVESDRIMREEQAQVALLQSRFEELTAREREVMELVVEGMANKQIGAKLGISEVTTKMHRGQVMRKMQAESVPALVRIAQGLGTCNRKKPLRHN
jgi:FixJ family two-component response regulator